jgi:hypothetical protein
MKHSLKFRLTTELEFWLKKKPVYTSTGAGNIETNLEFCTAIGGRDMRFHCIMHVENLKVRRTCLSLYRDQYPTYRLTLNTGFRGERYRTSNIIKGELSESWFYEILCQLLTYVLIQTDTVYQDKMSIIELISELDENRENYRL